MSDESLIRAALAEWGDAFCGKRIDCLMALYAPDAVIFDAIPPFSSGVDAMRTKVADCIQYFPDGFAVEKRDGGEIRRSLQFFDEAGDAVVSDCTSLHRPSERASHSPQSGGHTEKYSTPQNSSRRSDVYRTGARRTGARRFVDSAISSKIVRTFAVNQQLCSRSLAIAAWL